MSDSSSSESSSNSGSSCENFKQDEDGKYHFKKLRQEREHHSLEIYIPKFFNGIIWTDSVNVNLNRVIEKKEVSIVSYNFWFQNRKLNSRIRSLGRLVKNLNPDFITLQEMTPEILRIFMRQNWVRKYFISDYKGETIKPYGNIMLSKYRLHELVIMPFENTIMGRKMMLATYICEGGPQLILGTFHLESYPQDVQKRKEQLTLYNEYTSQSDTVILCGDTNFIDDDENAPLMPRFKDLWKELYQQTNEDKEKNPGYTFDTDTNLMAKEEHAPRKARIDRCFYTHKNIEPVSMQIIGDQPYDKNKSEYISDHYGIYMKLRIKS